MGDRPFKWCSFLGLLFLNFSRSSVTSQSLEEKIRKDPDLSQFYSLWEHSKIINVTLQFKQVTMFAPINAAFQKVSYFQEDTDDLVLYHIASVAKRTEQLGTSYTALYSELPGNPPLWIVHVKGSDHDDIYVNNARILVNQSNLQGSANSTPTQVLHKIDEILVPTVSPKSATNRIYNPTAWEFLVKYESLIQHPHRVREFLQKIEQHNKMDIFNTEGGHTFFIPVDEGFGYERASLVDGKIIDGHVIPRQVLFTTPTKKDVPYQTLANNDNDIRVVIFFTQEQRGDVVINYVKSHTLFGDGKHTPGVVLAKIVKPNIPVKNGVIHLIHKPLMVVDSSVRELLQEHMDYICNVGNTARRGNIPEPYNFENPEFNEKDGGILSSFLDAINAMDKSGQEFLNTLGRPATNITLFAPCNKALQDDLTLNSVLKDKTRFMEILKLHLVVDKKLYVDKTVQNSKAPTLSKGKYLYFNVINDGKSKVLTVEGGGVTATVIQPDLAATNGVIHIIDRVLGVPYTTVYDKLKSDPVLSESFRLGKYQGFNDQLNDTTKKFTYFVPSNKAWVDAKVKLPSAIKKLLMPEYGYHATTTLERHLVISDIPYTMERIKQYTNDSDEYDRRREIPLPTVRGSLKLSVIERKDNTFVINWKGEHIPVSRPNVECTNGIIHIIDAPFLKEGDIRVSKASIAIIGPQILILFFARVLLL